MIRAREGDVGTDQHWNRAAHRLVAEVVFNYLNLNHWAEES